MNFFLHKIVKWGRGCTSMWTYTLHLKLKKIEFKLVISLSHLYTGINLAVQFSGVCVYQQRSHSMFLSDDRKDTGAATPVLKIPPLL